MSIRDDIKAYIVKSGYTMTQLTNLLNERKNKTYTVQNFSNKLSRETIKYSEVLEIAEVLGYEIKWVLKTK